jgi:hypothetical protein
LVAPQLAIPKFLSHERKSLRQSSPQSFLRCHVAVTGFESGVDNSFLGWAD